MPITIGWGSTKDFNGQPFKIGKKITQEYADRLLVFDIENRFLPSLQKIPYWSEMNDKMKSAILDFGYNLGANFYGASGFNTITRVLKEKEWNEVPAVLELYSNPTSTFDPGFL